MSVPDENDGPREEPVLYVPTICTVGRGVRSRYVVEGVLTSKCYAACFSNLDHSVRKFTIKPMLDVMVVCATALLDYGCWKQSCAMLEKSAMRCIINSFECSSAKPLQNCE